MHRNALLAQEVEQRAVGVGVDAAEDVQCLDAFHRQIVLLLFMAQFVDGGKLQGVVAAAHPAGVEEVIGFFHVRTGLTG